MYNTQAARGAAPGPLTAVRLIFPHGLPLRWRGCCSYICFPGTTQVRQIANDLLLVHHISRLTVWCRNIAHHQKAECRIESARGLESESSPRVYAFRIKASRKRWWPRGHAPALALVCGAVQSAIPRKTAQDSPSALQGEHRPRSALHVQYKLLASAGGGSAWISASRKVTLAVGTSARSGLRRRAICDPSQNRAGFSFGAASRWLPLVTTCLSVWVVQAFASGKGENAPEVAS